MNKADGVRTLIKQHFWDMSDEDSLSTGDYCVVPEDAYDFLEEYAEKLNVDMTGFNFRRYFPNTGILFLPNAILPRYLQTDHHDPAPLTVQMLITSAEAGHWLYPDN
ncbi:hypothetical protein Xvie_00622 [Xenorhabdus vietnamensis]|uniref:Acyl carrier protein n=1 Tax=Xenorhabdus vietnamensis TaxID=351656 RepID=A0A1Y2SIT3_9GAMM|nr:DUF1493 family protein [Xenorhabdus vietnamensis]OTA17944.1 hypothetical protein Xvie_00622 [Xenorhabdus vietnamensis]